MPQSPTSPSPELTPLRRPSLLRVHPIVAYALVASVARIVALVRFYTGEGPLGHASAHDPLGFLMAAIPYHVGTIFLLTLPFLALTYIPKVRASAHHIALPVMATVVLYGQIDLELLRTLGTHLTAGFIAQYLSPLMFTDIGAGLGEGASHFYLSLSIVGLSWAAMIWFWWRAWARVDLRPSPRTLGALFILCLALILVPPRTAVSETRLFASTPAEILLLEDVFEAVQGPPEPPHEAIALLQRHLGLTPDSPLSPEHPLLRPSPVTHSPGIRPDIYLIVVESLRGYELTPAQRDPEQHPTLTALIDGGVAFNAFYSNGFPSANGFFALQCSAWPHPRRFALSALQNHGFDCLPSRLKALDYDTAFFTATNPAMDDQLPWAERLYDHLHSYEVRNHDRILVDDFLLYLDQQAQPDTDPLFAWIATTTTHFPFVINDAAHAETPSPDFHQRYRDTLAYTDRQLKRLIDGIESAAEVRGRPPLIVVVGDHSFPVDEAASAEMEAHACDRLIWTYAILYGPASFIGPPREENFPSSQVDLLPTIMEIVGDPHPTATVGRSLLGGDDPDRHMVAISHSGSRLDRAETSIFTSRDGTETWRQPTDDHRRCHLNPSHLSDPEAIDFVQVVKAWAWLLDQDRIAPR